MSPEVDLVDARPLLRRLTLRAALAVLASFLLAAPPLLLLVSARTPEGAACALTILALVAAPWLARRRRAALVATVVALACGAFALARAPSEAPAHGSRGRVVFLRAHASHRWWPTNLVPEVDQLAFATHLIWVVDPLIDPRRAERLRRAIREVYLHAREDVSFRATPSALDDALLDVDRGRLDVFVPDHDPRERLPGVVFLHGSAGSWKGYFALWSRLAARERFAVAQPSVGYGHWDRPEHLAAVERARRYLVEVAGCDPERLVIACLSNGGRAVTRVMAAGPRRYRGALFISAVIEPRVIDGGDLSAWRGAPALALHGAEDDRIPTGYLAEGVEALTDAGVHLRVTLVPREDHFLIFTRPALVFDAVGAWLRGAWAPPPR